MRIVYIILALLFFLFAYFQLNDVDPILWVSLYAYIGIHGILGAMGKESKYTLLAGIVVCVIWAVTMVPDFLDWINMGMPSITSSMKAEAPHIELTREFLGLFIAILALVFMYYKQNGNSLWGKSS